MVSQDECQGMRQALEDAESRFNFSVRTTMLYHFYSARGGPTRGSRTKKNRRGCVCRPKVPLQHLILRCHGTWLDSYCLLAICGLWFAVLQGDSEISPDMMPEIRKYSTRCLFLWLSHGVCVRHNIMRAIYNVVLCSHAIYIPGLAV